MSRAEGAFLAAVLRALNAPGRRTRVWRQQAGRVRVADRWIHLAPAGAADLTGYGPGGVRLEVEVKAARGRQRAEQRRWQGIMERAGVVYVLVHDLPGVPLAVAAAAAVARVDEALAWHLGDEEGRCS